jgi:GntR family transcriptional repressor for pyruvate dehydrogenase complex
VLPVNIDHSTAQHRAIADAILQSSPAKARRAMERHCDDTAALLRGLLA